MSYAPKTWNSVTNSRFGKRNHCEAKPHILNELCEKWQQDLITNSAQNSSLTPEQAKKQVEQTVLRFAPNQNGRLVWQVHENHIYDFLAVYKDYTEKKADNKNWVSIHNQKKIKNIGIGSYKLNLLIETAEDMHQHHVDKTKNSIAESYRNLPKDLEYQAKKEVEENVIRSNSTAAGNDTWSFHINHKNEFLERYKEKTESVAFVASTNQKKLNKHDIFCGHDTATKYILKIATRYAQWKQQEGMSREEARDYVTKHIAKKLDNGHWAIHPDLLQDLKREIDNQKEWISSAQKEVMKELLGVTLRPQEANIIMERFHDAKIQELQRDFPSKEDTTRHVEEHIVRPAYGLRGHLRWEMHQDYASELKNHTYSPRTTSWKSLKSIGEETGENPNTIRTRLKKYTRELSNALQETGLSPEETDNYVKRHVADTLTFSPGRRATFINQKHLPKIVAFNAAAPITTQLFMPPEDLSRTQEKNVEALRKTLLQAPNREL